MKAHISSWLRLWQISGIANQNRDSLGAQYIAFCFYTMLHFSWQTLLWSRKFRIAKGHYCQLLTGKICLFHTYINRKKLNALSLICYASNLFSISASVFFVSISKYHDAVLIVSYFSEWCHLFLNRWISYKVNLPSHTAFSTISLFMNVD